ncbi:hypothetical protein [Streptomyces sp. NPDC046805]|uniref:hypothetical protein n=1 Tax=Streptomyces sp. NPDC046805 TaxID=3155134 RepID=UPI0033F48DFF
MTPVEQLDRNAAGKAFAVLDDQGVAFRLLAGSPAFDEAPALSGAAVFRPAPGRAMKDWVAVPTAHAERYTHFADAALTVLG